MRTLKEQTYFSWAILVPEPGGRGRAHCAIKAMTIKPRGYMVRLKLSPLRSTQRNDDII